MRAAFGLIGVLGALAAIVVIMGSKGGYLDQAKQSIDEGKKATIQVQDMSGRDEDNKPVTDAGKFAMNLDGSKTSGVTVVALDPTSLLAVRYGLKKDDVIVQIGPLPVRDIISSDKEAAEYIQDAYARRFPLSIVRSGARMELTLADRLPTQAPPKTTFTPAESEKSALEKKLEGLKNAGGK